MPNRIYIHKSGKEAPGHKIGKKRLTLILCDNTARHMIKYGAEYKEPYTLKNKLKIRLYYINIITIAIILFYYSYYY